MIKADVTYDKRAMLAFMRFTAVDRFWKWFVYGAIFLFTLVLTICNIGNDFLPFAIILLVFVSIVEFLALFAYFINPQIKLKNFTDNNIVINHFSFEDKVIKLRSESKARKGESELPYSAFKKIDESSSAIYLFVNKSSALIVTKSEITEGSVDELKRFLISKVPNKKINKLSVK